MEFRILGPLEVVDHGLLIALGGRQRALLAFLLLHPNEAVSTERLIDALWGERPPDTAQAALQVHVSQLRKALGPTRIETRQPGYVLRIAPEELDAARFETLVLPADGGDDRTARLREALGLWRGPALADFQYEPWAQSEVARLDELRLAVVEERVDAELALGWHGRLVPDLEALVREHPLRERLRGQLMLALYRCRRQAEALAVYQETRRLLVEELGIEPGPELQELHRQLLNQDAELAAPPPTEPPPAPPLEPREERKVVSVLFCDLVGFTSHAETLDPEDVNELLSRYHLRLRAELERFGGTVEKFVGDAVLALFGAPVAHEDDTERALRAALAIRDWMAELQDDLQVRIGISTGEALVRLGAQPAQGEPMAVGDVVNTAARLQQAAHPGGVLVSESTYRATRDTIGYERLEPVDVKGKAEPVPVWEAKHPRAGQAVDLDRPTTPFIGRREDLGLVRQTYERVLGESSFQLVTIVGEPGIGKTRLLAELRSVVEADPGRMLWRQGRCLPYGEGITFWALGEIVKTHSGILESDTPTAAADKLRAAVDLIAAGSDRTWLHATLGPLVGICRTRDGVEREEAFAAWRIFLEGIAGEQPLVLAIEDLHWADPAMLVFLDQLGDLSADLPMFLVATARPELYEREPAWGGGKRNSTTIALSPLSDTDTARLVDHLLAKTSLPPQTMAALLERAGGNPLYAEEFVRMLRDRGLLVPGTAGEAEISVPESVHAVIAARVDTLAPERKQLLHDASVVGKVFWAGALAAMGRASKESVLAGLHELVRKELVRRVRTSSIADDVEYLFWHALVRDVAYGQIPRAARAQKHVAAAQWIERIAGERITDHAEFLANHYATALELANATGDEATACELVDRAVRFGSLAAERAIRLDHAQGERYYRRTLALLPEDDPRRPRLLADAADAGTMAGASFEQIRPELEQAIAALRAQGDVVAAARAMRQLAHLLLLRGESLESRLTLVDGARRLLEREAPGAELALVYARLANEYTVSGYPREAAEWAVRALPLLERFQLTDHALATRSRLEASRCELGDLAALGELRNVAREATDPARGYGTYEICVVLNNLSAAEHWYGRGPEAAAKPLRDAHELALRRGLERPSQWFKAGLVETSYDLGEWDDALRYADEVNAWESTRGRSSIGVLGGPIAAMILAARGEPGAAAARIDEVLARARELQGPGILIPALLAAAVVAVAQRTLASAAAHVDELEQLASSATGFVGYLPELGRVCVQTDKLSSLERLLTASAGLNPLLGRFVSTAEALLAEARGGHDRALRVYSEAAGSWQECHCVVEQAHALLGIGRCRVALGLGPDAAEPLREARQIYATLGARPFVAAADELLQQSRVRS